MSLHNLHLLKSDVSKRLFELRKDRSRSFSDKKDEIRHSLVILKSIDLKINRILCQG